MSTHYNSYIRLLQPQIRKLSSHVASSRKTHYDSLGISSQATQADVKSAYYKLSMVYHPDRNKDSQDAATRFRDIAEAYKVLSNVKSRKLYDRGLYFGSGISATYDEPVNKFYKSRETKSRPPAPHGRTTVYDFDEWSRSHYGATFQKDLRFRERQKFRRENREQSVEDVKSEKVIFLVGVLILLSAYLFYDQDYDSTNNVPLYRSSDVMINPQRKAN